MVGSVNDNHLTTRGNAVFGCERQHRSVILGYDSSWNHGQVIQSVHRRTEKRSHVHCHVIADGSSVCI